MSNPDHWNALASSLGAEAPPETAAESPRAVPPAPPPRRQPSPAAKKHAAQLSTDWGQLANELGLSPQEPIPQAPSQQPAARQRERDVAWRDEPGRPPDAHPRGRDSLPDTTIEEFDDDMVVDAELVEEHELGDVESESIGESQSAEGEQTGRRRRRRRRGGRRSRRDRGPADGEAREGGGLRENRATGEQPGGGAADEFGGEAAGSLSEERPKRGRRRRKRGSGRSREGSRPGDDETRTASADVARSDDADLDEESLGIDTTAPGDADLGDEAGDSSLDKNSHRAIPAWEEAIGYIVSVNMESRAKNPKSGSPRGRGRGRGRGSRGHDRRSS